MYCPKCGALNPDHARLCRACGQVMAPGTPNDSTTGQHVSRWATAALVLGILSAFTCMLTALPAIVAGIVAMVKIGNSNGRLKGLGMAIAGMVLPFALLPFMAIGMGVLMPALARTRQLAFRMTCGTNLQGLGKAMYIYAYDNNDRFPTPSKWCDLLSQHAEVAPAIFRCKGRNEGPCNYAMNKAAEGLGTNAPPDMVLLFETAPGWNQTGGAEILTVENHQGDGCNVLFVDGHVEFVKPEGLPQLRWTAGDSVLRKPAAYWLPDRPAAIATD
jgi:prepilin-type processing-associated H-X9-DG protein